MPLFRYFVVVGLALVGLLYAVSAMLTDNAPSHISNNIDGITTNNLERNRSARQQYVAPVATSAPEPDMPSSTAVPAAAPPVSASAVTSAPEPDMPLSAAVPAAAPPASASQNLNVPSARIATGTSPNNARNRSARKRVWRNDFRRYRSWRDPFWDNWRWR